MKRKLLRYFLLLPFLAISTWSNALDLPVKVVKGIEVYYYKVNNNESVYGISKKLGISREDIVRHNPSVADGVKRGMLLYFPVEEYRTVEEAPASAPETGEEQVETADTTEVAARHTPSITLLLPFGLDSEEPSRENKFALDFYKGFLIGADTLRNRNGAIDINVIDIDDKSRDMADILSLPVVKDASVVVAPSDAKWLSAIGDSATANGNYVFNVFVIQDSLFLTNPQILQANIPQKSMYKLATDALMAEFDGYKPVVLRNKEGRNEKESFVNYVCERYRGNGTEPIIIEYETNLRTADLETLPVENGERYVFIPSSGSLAEFNRFAFVVKAFRDKAMTLELGEEIDLAGETRSNVELFGYPDWTVFRGEALDTLHKLNATIYSRFNDTFNNYSFQNIEAEFRRWYGSEILESVPSQALLGYDTACMLIKNLLINLGTFNPIYPQRYEGIQSTFDFDKAGEGFCNESLYIINYQPGGHTSAHAL